MTAITQTMPMREGYGRALAAYGADNPDVVVLDADTSSSTLARFFADCYPRSILQAFRLWN